MGGLRSSSRGAVRPLQPPPHAATSSAGAFELTATSANAAAYMDAHLADTVRGSLERCISEQPRDPIRFVAESLHQLRRETDTEGVAAASAELPRRAAPATVRLDDGVKYELRPLSHDFQRLAGGGAAGVTTVSAFPAVQYREAIPTYDVAACLRQLHLVDPAAALVLLVESPQPTTTVFFYEGVAYACAGASAGKTVARSVLPATAAKPSLASLQQALGEEKVHEFVSALRTAAKEAVPGVQIEFIPSVQADYLAPFDVMDRVVRAAPGTSSGGSGDYTRAASPTRSSRVGLPTVLLVSYRADTAHLTYARLLSSYGPRYEAAQRGYLQQFRASQLERRRTFTFAYAVRHWADVQRQRLPAASATRAPNALSKSSSTTDPKSRSVDNGTAAAAAAAVPEAATEKAAAGGPVPTSAEGKRGAARAPKRAVVAYDAVHQAEDDVFLVVMRRLEHAAATLIQSVVRGYRARRLYAEARRNSTGVAKEASALAATSSSGGVDSTTRGASVPVVPPAPRPPMPPLLEACLERLFREGDAFGSLWGDYVTSPPPESRRSWLYRPVQHHHTPNGGDAAQPDGAETQPLAARVGEGWVQEELLLPPLRATQPRRHLNLFQRLTDYLGLAHCTTLRDSVQLLTDAPGMSVLQRRAYDGVKAICLTLFHLAYAELRQRYPGANVPSTFSVYMRTTHAAVLGWFSVPHECSLLVRAVSAGGAGTSATLVRHGENASLAEAEHAMRVTVRGQLTAHETLVLARHALHSHGKAPAASAPAATSSRADLLSIAPHVCVAAQPLLAREEWVQAVMFLVEAEGERAADAPPLSVEWISAAPTPLGCVNGVPVAAVRRSDGQRVDGVPVYDAFVPRVHGPPRRTAAAAFSDEGGSAQTTGRDGAVAAAAPFTNTAGVVEAWLRGDLARASDVALVQHLYRSLATPRGLVYYRVRSRASSYVSADAPSFTVVAPTAGLARETWFPLQASERGDPSEQADAASPGLQADPSVTVSTAGTPRRRSAQRGEGWERVMEAVAQGSAAAAVRRSISRASSILTTPSASIGALGWSRSASSFAPTGLGSVARVSAVLGHADVDPPDASEEQDTVRPEEEEVRVCTVDEVAKEVDTAVAASITLTHRRTLLCQVAGAETAARLDLFLDQVAETLQQEKYQPNVVLALELPSQGFFALAAALLAFRLHDTRDISGWASSKLNTASASTEPRAALKEPRLAFLAGFHAALEVALPTPSSSRAPVQITAVQTSVQRVSQLMETLALLQLNVLQALQRAVAEAEVSAAPSSAIVRACQLAEQYALLVLLDYYLWSNASSVTPSGAVLSARGLTVRTSGNNTFAAFLAGVPAALEWIAEVDPWHPSFTTRASPDALHARYSNALRRWDDKRYVCFGAL